MLQLFVNFFRSSSFSSGELDSLPIGCSFFNLDRALSLNLPKVDIPSSFLIPYPSGIVTRTAVFDLEMANLSVESISVNFSPGILIFQLN